LNYLDGKYYFRSSEGIFEFSPGEESIVQLAMGSVENYVHLWSIYLRREIEAPNLWAEMEKYRISVSLALPEQVLNEPIPTHEAEEIANKMQALADKIDEQFELNTDQSQFVHSKLNYLAEAAKRQRSMDLVYTSIGFFGTIAMGLALTPDKTRELWQLM